MGLSLLLGVVVWYTILLFYLLLTVAAIVVVSGSVVMLLLFSHWLPLWLLLLLLSSLPVVAIAVVNGGIMLLLLFFSLVDRCGYSGCPLVLCYAVPVAVIMPLFRTRPPLRTLSVPRLLGKQEILSPQLSIRAHGRVTTLSYSRQPARIYRVPESQPSQTDADEGRF